jgi:hypothetical protein
MARRKKGNSYDALTVSMPLSITLKDGTTATGMLWLHPSRRGRLKSSTAWCESPMDAPITLAKDIL